MRVGAGAGVGQLHARAPGFLRDTQGSKGKGKVSAANAGGCEHGWISESGTDVRVCEKCGAVQPIAGGAAVVESTVPRKKIEPPALAAALGLADREITAEDLRAWWSRLSGRLFGGKLPEASVTVARCQSPRSLSESYQKGGVWHVVVAPHVVTWGEVQAVAALLHEALHVYCCAVLSAPELSYSGHGPTFCAEANRCARELGMSLRVHERGAAGLARPGLWPGAWELRPRVPALAPRAATPAPVAAPRPELEAEVARLRAAAAGSVPLEALRMFRADLERVRDARAAVLETLRAEGRTSGGAVQQARALVGLATDVLEAFDARFREAVKR